MTGGDSVLDWLLDADPAIRWQVMRDLLDAPQPQWSAERAAVETSGWGARLLGLADEDGQWAGGAFAPRGFEPQEWHEVGQPWTATSFTLQQLREFGLDPGSESAARTVALVGTHSRWDHDGQPYWEGEVEECINGRTLADGAYFGVDVSPSPSGSAASASPTAGGTARGSTARSARPSTAPSTCWKGCWSSSGPPAAPRRPGRRAPRARSICWHAACSAA
ncbi:hypothetical protein ACFQZ4_09065 [Catellatospora coxensis]